MTDSGDSLCVSECNLVAGRQKLSSPIYPAVLHKHLVGEAVAVEIHQSRERLARPPAPVVIAADAVI